ncbi:hypothetical protein ACFWIJ_18370 [Streptomyces sp. NPDC127079]|uniref:hypothetical protein n=1 Tax=Streptomyces sp. NPDC127079 TaxID=3347132 RepID=UPI003649D0FD
MQIVGSRADLTEVAEHAFLPSAQFAVLLPHTGRAAGDLLQDLAVPTLPHLVCSAVIPAWGSASIRRFSPNSPKIFSMPVVPRALPSR